MRISHSIHTKTLTFALATACMALAQPPGGGRGAMLGFGGGLGLGVFAEKTITGAPFSAQQNTQSQRILANGNQIQRQEQASIYRDSQGRVRIDASLSGGTQSSQTRTEITIFDPVAGYVYRLNPQTMKGVQSPLRHNMQGADRGVPSTNGNTDVQTQNLGTQTINGVAATGTQVTHTIQIVRVTWVSTALQIPVQVTRSDPRTGTVSMNLTNIVQSEPSASLFVVPSGYTISPLPGRGRGGPQFRRP